MTGPEAQYARLTSGNAGTIAMVESDLRDAVRDLAACVDQIVQATDHPVWQSSATYAFNMRSWATEAAVQVSQVRCDRAKLAVRAMGADHTWVTGEAERIIAYWRTQRPRFQQIPPLFLLLRTLVMAAFDDVREQYEQRLREAVDLFDSEELSNYQQAWFALGLLKLMRFDLSSPTNLGPPIPDALLGGDDDSGGAAQGLGVDPATGNLLQTSYNADGDAVLSVVDPDTGEVLNTVNLGEGQYEDVFGREQGAQAPDHAGGVMVDGDSVYVMSSTNPPSMYEYSLSDVTGRAPGETVPVQNVTSNMEAGAYSTISDGVMYVGTHESGGGTVHTYEKNADGEWVATGDTFDAPPYAQGIAVRDGVVYYTSSLGRGGDPAGGMLHAYDLDGNPISSEPLPHMAEGVVATENGLVVTYESGSAKYQDPDGTEFSELYPTPSMTLTPYSELGVGGEIEVEPVTLEEAARQFRVAESRVDGVEGRVGRISLPASALGQVGVSGWVSSTLEAFLDETARWLRDGNLSAGVTADGLVDAARQYDETDHAEADDFQRLLGLT